MKTPILLMATLLIFTILGCDKPKLVSPADAVSGAGSGRVNLDRSEGTAPIVKAVQIEPAAPKADESIKVTAVIDGDENTDRYVSYKWYINGEESFESGEELDSSNYEKGDSIRVVVVAEDENGQSLPREASAKVANTPPVITSTPPTSFSGGDYSYDVDAEDLDDDELTFSLQGAPEGMTIDESSGYISWSIPEGFKGAVSVNVAVKDDQGAGMSQGFGFTVGE